ncbi:MAG TPA: MBOAT family protein, partial [Verrucomicrobiae bacterium]|nr:MBOAT family protein [Verrucomicrobiae bacterium]
ICTRFARRFENLLARRNFTTLPLQTPWARERFKALSDADYLAEMRLLYPDGKTFGGADALIEIARHYWWAWPAFILGHIPPFRALMRAGYRWFARNRGCATHACEIHPAKKPRLTFIDFLPLLVLPAVAACFRTLLVPWAFACVMPLAIFAGFKWLTYREAAPALKTKNTFRTLGYFFAWPGMDAAKFLSKEIVPAKPRLTEWLVAIAETVFGIALVWGGARLVLPDHPLLAGWIALVGIVFILHFGFFHILSVAWRAIGVEARPFMDNPVAAVSLAEFWGRRWNTAFNILAFRYAFLPLRRTMNLAMTTLMVFLLSGLVHDLVISLPANGGYGLPTIYFIVQGLGILVERTTFARHLGLGHGVRGWLFTAIVAAGPVFILAHPPYIKTVILPMLHALGAT